MQISSVVLASVLLLLPALASAQASTADEIAPAQEVVPPVEATVTATPAEALAVPTPPTVPTPPPTAYAVTAPIAYPPLPVRDPSTRPSFETSIALHVTAAIAGPIGLVGLFFGAVLAILCSSGGSCGATAAGLAIAGAVFETASIAIGIAATAVHSRTRARVRAWEMGVARVAPWGGPTGGGAAFTLAF